MSPPPRPGSSLTIVFLVPTTYQSHCCPQTFYPDYFPCLGGLRQACLPNQPTPPYPANFCSWLSFPKLSWTALPSPLPTSPPFLQQIVSSPLLRVRLWNVAVTKKAKVPASMELTVLILVFKYASITAPILLYIVCPWSPYLISKHVLILYTRYPLDSVYMWVHGIVLVLALKQSRCGNRHVS